MKRKSASVSIEIENSTLAPVINLDGNATRRTMPLTTMVDDQQRALVRIYLVKTSEKILLKEFDLRNLPPRPSGETRFLFSCDYDGRYAIKIHLTVDGRSLGAETIQLKRLLHPRGRRTLIAVALLLLMTLAALVFVRGCTEEIEAPVAVLETERERAAPAESAPPEEVITSDETHETITVERELTVYFHADDPRLTDTAREQLRELGREIASWSNVSVLVEGHCALSGTEAGRLELSRRRAENSAAALLTTGVVPEEQLSVAWFGATRLVTRTPDNEHLNRRVEITVRGEKAAEQDNAGGGRF